MITFNKLKCACHRLVFSYLAEVILMKQQGRGGISFFFFFFWAGCHVSAMPTETPNLELWMRATTCTTTTAVASDTCPRTQEGRQQLVHTLPQCCSGSRGARTEALALCAFWWQCRIFFQSFTEKHIQCCWCWVRLRKTGTSWNVAR